MNITRAFALIAVLCSVLSCAHPGDVCPVTGDDFPCHRATVIEDHALGGETCLRSTLEDGQPCRTGVGICTSGKCAMPDDSPPSCIQGFSVVIQTAVCNADEDCHGTNVCADYSCPMPGQDVCLVLPKPDGTHCGNGFSCLHGECCLATPPESCESLQFCPAIEDCTVGLCSVMGLCEFTRSKAGDACSTPDGTAGICEQRSPDEVPRCFPLGG